MEVWDRARSFVYRNARPLDMARWNCLFENASNQEALRILRAYQNPDGGFGHALEPDCWNPYSTPLQTWAATAVIREVGSDDGKHPLITGILRYLCSGDGFDGHLWSGLNAVSSNDAFPHAPWWAYTNPQESGYNPTASLAGFLLRYADRDTPAYDLGRRLAREAYAYFEKSFPLAFMHEAACFVELYEYMKASGIHDLVDLGAFKALLLQQIKRSVTHDTAGWGIDYACKPSLFIGGKESDFYEDNKDICGFECDFIRRTQNADGAWDVTWRWSEYPEQWAISKNWWKSDIVIKNMRFLQEFDA